MVVVENHRRPGSLFARTQMTPSRDSRTVLFMRKQDDQPKWPFQEFSQFLNGLMVQAGIPLTGEGSPNTVVFEELTGVSPGQISRYRKGKNQPTVESLRKIAAGLAPRLDVDPAALLISLEVRAGRRSEAEVRAGAQARAVGEGAPLRDPEGYIRRARELASHEGTDEERRESIMAEVRKAEASLELARSIENSAITLLRVVVEDAEARENTDR